MNIFRKLGWVAGTCGALFCLAGALFRLGGVFWVAGFQTGTLMQVGTSIMVFGCFCLLVVLTQRS